VRTLLILFFAECVWAQTNITPTTPSRTDTTVQGSVNPAGPTYPGPIGGPTPGILYTLTLRECLDSLYVHLCDVPSGSDMEDTYLQVINLAAACTVRTGMGYCLPSWNFPCPPFCPPPGFGGNRAGIKLYHDPTAGGTNDLLLALPAPMRLAQGDQLLILVQPEMAPDPTDVLTFQLKVIEYRYPHSGNPALGLPTPSIAPRLRRICFNGFVARDTFQTGINDPNIQHRWYINGQLVPGANGPTFIASFNQRGPHTVVAEVRWRTASHCIPPNVPWPRDTAIVETDTLPDEEVHINGSPYYHGTYASFTGTPPLCLIYQSQSGQTDFSYNWVINRSSYTGPGPHTECYTVNRLDTVVFSVRNGTCTRVDTIYVIVDVGIPTDISTAQVGSFRHYPNPAREELWLLGDQSGLWHIEIWTLDGRKVWEWHGYLPNRVSLPGTLSRGAYLLRYRGSELAGSSMLLVQ